MQTIMLSIIIILISMGGLAIGLFFGRAPIKGSCGGLACSGLECGACPRRKKEQ
jgi:hypothetical protein